MLLHIEVSIIKKYGKYVPRLNWPMYRAKSVPMRRLLVSIPRSEMSPACCMNYSKRGTMQITIRQFESELLMLG